MARRRTPPTEINLDTLLSVSVAAQISGIGRTKLYAATDDGTCPVYFVGKVRRIRYRDLLAYMETLREPR